MKLQVLIKEALVVYLLLTHVLHYTALFTCEQGSSTFFDIRDNSRIISSIIIIIYIYIIYIDNIYINSIYIYINIYIYIFFKAVVVIMCDFFFKLLKTHFFVMHSFSLFLIFRSHLIR